MGEVLPFTGRFFAVRDWTAAERAQIQALARELKAHAGGVEVVFGASDAGDPWCVIKDDQENVLMHVARIGRVVVIHDMVADLVTEGRDLWFALGRMEGVDLAAPPRDLAPVEHELERRNAQFLVAIVAGAAFGLDPVAAFGDARPPEEIDLSPAAETAAADDLIAAVMQTLSGPRAVVQDFAADAMDPQSARPEGASPEAPRVKVDAVEPHHSAAAPQTEAAKPVDVEGDEAHEAPAQPIEIHGSAGDDTLEGSAAAEVIRGGPGDDVISGGGAPTGQVDVLDGGSGDDQIAVDSSVVAEGGSGADTFVVTPPAVSGRGSTNLGVIIDFDGSAGDTLKFDTAQKVTITSITPVDNILAEAAGSATLASASAVPGDRVGVDVDGDGVEDGYVLVASVDDKVPQAHGELGSTTSGAPEQAYFDGELLTVGASIWISADDL